MPVRDKAQPEEKPAIKRTPKAKPQNKEQPEEAVLDKEQPEPKALDKDQPKEKELNKEMPPLVNPEDVIKIGNKEVVIQPTKLKYQRNRTAAAYRILDLYPLPDVLAMDRGILDPERDGDAIVFDFLTAVFNDSKFVAEHYDEMDTEVVDRALKIFKRLNKIDEKEEAVKNREAKGTKA